MKKLLIVDDTNIVRAMLKAHLKGTFEIMEAINADDALDKIPTFQPDAIVLDIQMPEGTMDGNELCKVLKTDLKTKDIYILMLTADWRTVQKEGDDFAANDFTFKPFHGKDILAMLKKGMGLEEKQ